MVSGSPGCNPSSDHDALLPGCNPSSDHDARLRSGARSGLKRELASILRSQVDSTLSRTRSGKSSTSDRHTLNKKAKKSPLAADQSLIPPILSPAAAAAATSIQNGKHATNLDRSQTGMALLVTPGRRFTGSSLVQRPSIAGEGDPAAKSKTNVDVQAAAAVLEIPGILHQTSRQEPISSEAASDPMPPGGHQADIIRGAETRVVRSKTKELLAD